MNHTAIRESLHPSFKSDRLTPRELQIAELVALGRTDAQIGKEIWISENSVKQALKRSLLCHIVSGSIGIISQN